MAGLPNSRRLRHGHLDPFKQSLLGVLRQELFKPGFAGEQLWQHGLVSRLLAAGSLGARTTGRCPPQGRFPVSGRTCQNA